MGPIPLNAIAPCSSTPEESQVERYEHQDDSNIHQQPFPKPVSEKHEIYGDDDGCHRDDVKHDRYLPAHFSPPRTGAIDQCSRIPRVSDGLVSTARPYGPWQASPRWCRN